jgi:hypothetical protein
LSAFRIAHGRVRVEPARICPCINADPNDPRTDIVGDVVSTAGFRRTGACTSSAQLAMGNLVDLVREQPRRIEE